MIHESKTARLVYCGRRFSTAEIKLVRDLVADFPGLSLTEIARTICELLEWKRPNGRLKNHECRLLLEKLSVAGLLNLPSLRVCGSRGPRIVILTDNGAEQERLQHLQIFPARGIFRPPLLTTGVGELYCERLLFVLKNM